MIRAFLIQQHAVLGQKQPLSSRDAFEHQIPLARRDGFRTTAIDADPNFGERYRQGDPISTAFVESTINQVVSKRFVKRQQMQWSQKGAHLLLQTRTKVLDGDLEDVFRGWYPQFRPIST